MLGGIVCLTLLHTQLGAEPAEGDTWSRILCGIVLFGVKRKMKRIF